MRSEEYERVIRAVIEEEHTVIGDLAHTKAAEVDGITVEDGAVTFTKEMGERQLVDLVERYRDFQGEGVKGIVKRAVDKTRIEPSFLPDDILPPSTERGLWAVGAAAAGILLAVVVFQFRQHLFEFHSLLVSGAIGSGFAEVTSPAVAFSLVAAFVIGVGHDFLPCSIPVWTTLVPSPDDEEGMSLGRFGYRATRYFAGSALVLAVFGAVLGFFGASIKPLIATFNQTLPRIVVGALIFGPIGIISLLWGLSLFNYDALPNINIYGRARRLSDRSRILHQDLVDGMLFGGAEVGCPFPTYHLLLLWIVVNGDPLYGALLLSVFTLGKTFPIALVGGVLRTRAHGFLNRFRVGHDVFDLFNGALLIGMGSFIVFIFAQMVFIGPTHGNPVIIFGLLQALIGGGIAYAALAIYRWTRPTGWRLLSVTGLVISAWSFISLVSYSFDITPLTPAVVDGLGIPIIAALVSLAATYFISHDLPIPSPDWFRTGPVLTYLAAIGGIAAWYGYSAYGGSAGLFTVMYVATPLLVLPAVYGLHRIKTVSDLHTWTYFYLAAVLLLGSTLLGGYGAIACGAGGPAATADICADYGYGFVSLTGLSIPFIAPLVSLGAMAPLLLLLGIASFGEGVFLFYHRMYEPVRRATSIEGNRLEQLLRGALDALDDLVGTEVAERMLQEAVEEVDDVSVKFEDDEPLVTMTVSIDSEEKFDEMSEALLTAADDAVGEKAVGRIRTVVDDIRALASEMDAADTSDEPDTDYGEFVSTRTVDEVKDAVAERDLDPEKVLDAEAEHDDRVTLKRWLERRINDEA